MSSEIVFFLNGNKQRVDGVPPTMTLMNWLRRHKRLTGTKEGCAEGDCGACTVAVGEMRNGAVRYRAVNSCIMLLPMLHEKLVLTVESLHGPRGELHPVQQALVDCHGSQCGFCTPGFVMSLYAAYVTEPFKDGQRTNDVLAGNLCRCTGYGPIVQAAEKMYLLPRPEWDVKRRRDDLANLSSIKSTASLSYVEAGSTFEAPSDTGELCRIYGANPGATIVSGATDVGLWVTKQHRILPKIIYTGRVDELLKIEETAGVLKIGAGVSWTDAKAAIENRWPSFGELLRRFGSEQVRNSGTIGGNIANGSPIGDGSPALIALGATARLRKGDAVRTVPLENFFIAYGKQDRLPGEIVEEIEIPLSASADEFRCYKISKRFDQDISAICGCFNIRLRDGAVADARICFGGMAATPKRAAAVEGSLIGSVWTVEAVQAAMRSFDTDYAPISDMRASAAYRMKAASNLLLRYFHERSGAMGSIQLAGSLIPAFA